MPAFLPSAAMSKMPYPAIRPIAVSPAAIVGRPPANRFEGNGCSRAFRLRHLTTASVDSYLAFKPHSSFPKHCYFCISAERLRFFEGRLRRLLRIPRPWDFVATGNPPRIHSIVTIVSAFRPSFRPIDQYPSHRISYRLSFVATCSLHLA